MSCSMASWVFITTVFGLATLGACDGPTLRRSDKRSKFLVPSDGPLPSSLVEKEPEDPPGNQLADPSVNPSDPLGPANENEALNAAGGEMVQAANALGSGGSNSVGADDAGMIKAADALGSGGTLGSSGGADDIGMVKAADPLASDQQGVDPLSFANGVPPAPSPAPFDGGAGLGMIEAEASEAAQATTASAAAPASKNLDGDIKKAQGETDKAMKSMATAAWDLQKAQNEAAKNAADTYKSVKELQKTQIAFATDLAKKTKKLEERITESKQKVAVDAEALYRKVKQEIANTLEKLKEVVNDNGGGGAPAPGR